MSKPTDDTYIPCPPIVSVHPHATGVGVVYVYEDGTRLWEQYKHGELVFTRMVRVPYWKDE